MTNSRPAGCSTPCTYNFALTPLTLIFRIVLRRVIPAFLVVGAATGGAHVDQFELGRIGRHAERHADESARLRLGAGTRFAGEIDFDSSVLKLRPGDNRESVLAAVRGDPYSLAPFVSHRLGLHPA